MERQPRWDTFNYPPRYHLPYCFITTLWETQEQEKISILDELPVVTGNWIYITAHVFEVNSRGTAVIYFSIHQWKSAKTTFAETGHVFRERKEEVCWRNDLSITFKPIPFFTASCAIQHQLMTLYLTIQGALLHWMCCSAVCQHRSPTGLCPKPILQNLTSLSPSHQNPHMCRRRSFSRLFLLLALNWIIIRNFFLFL